MAANAQNRFNEENLQATTTQARSAALDEFAALEERRAQLRERASQDVNQIARDSRSLQAEAENALAGAEGNSAAALLRDFERQELQFIANTRGELAGEESNITREAKAARARQAARIAGATRAKVRGPLEGLGLVQTGLDLTAGVLGGTSQISRAGQAGALGIP